MVKNELRNQMYEVINSLPQRQYISDINIDKWVEYVLENQPENALFLVKRLGHIGGSDIGVLVQSVRNRNAEFISDIGHTHRTDWDVISDKLLKNLPQEAFGNLRRGSKLEPLARSEYESLLKSRYKKVIRRTDITKHIVQHQSKKLIWSRVQVDDVWQCDDRLILVDYKVPSANAFKQMLYLEPLAYSCQVVTGKMIAEELGYHIDELWVLPFNTDDLSFAELSVDIDRDLESEIKEVGDYYFSLINQGRMPPPAFPKYAIQGTQDLNPQLVNNLHEDSVLRLLAMAVKQRQDELTPQIDMQLKQLHSATGSGDDYRINVGCLNLTGVNKRTLDKNEVSEFLISKGMPETEVSKAAKRADSLVKKLSSVLPNKEDHEQFYDVNFQINLGLIRDTEGKRREFRNMVTEELNNHLSEIISSVVPVISEHSRLQDNKESINNAQMKQLGTLSKLIENAPNEMVKEKAEKTRNLRAKLYSQTLIPTQDSDSDKQQIAAKTSSPLEEVIGKELSSLIRFRM